MTGLARKAELLNAMLRRRAMLEGRLRAVVLTTSLADVRELKRELSYLNVRIMRLERKLR